MKVKPDIYVLHPNPVIEWGEDGRVVAFLIEKEEEKYGAVVVLKPGGLGVSPKDIFSMDGYPDPALDGGRCECDMVATL